MMTSFMNAFALFFLTLASLAASLPLSIRDVFVPPVLYPHDGTVWAVGQKHNVTWDVSNPPAQITNPLGEIFLAKGGILLDLDQPLAANFSILLGRIEVTVPDVEPGSDYSVVVFGDSGNYSPNFTITN
ncbi:hypothetical protein NM688_g5886 [Phlebia brevispora]|uniref:Uncharacterized protein n=1 Tax=Phlebia brevispora TaxID=194682 RepID=A0ACC1SND7_9APHY|nr:hypothetical protein NM688_g5886 [Phlebia brevispora]